MLLLLLPLSDGPRSATVPVSSDTPAPPRGIVAILLTIIPLSQIPLDVYTPALPRMALDLHAASASVQNTVTAYMLGMSLAFIPIGVMADAWGRKRVVLACLSVVVLTSVGCAVAPNIVVLLVLRFAQGAAACACMVVTYAIAADCFSGARLTSVSGVLGAAWGVAPVLAPGVGGLLVQFISWRAIFVLIAGLAACAAAIVAIALPETLAPPARSPIDERSTARTAFGALRNRVFVCFVLVFGVMAAAQLTFGVVSPFLYQDGLGFPPSRLRRDRIGGRIQQPHGRIGLRCTGGQDFDASARVRCAGNLRRRHRDPDRVGRDDRYVGLGNHPRRMPGAGRLWRALPADVRPRAGIVQS